MSRPNVQVQCVQCVWGVKVLERVKYRITMQCERHWWWGFRETFSIESEFMSLGGFESFTDARSAIRACGGQYVEA
jgi:hypothetical protein